MKKIINIFILISLCFSCIITACSEDNSDGSSIGIAKLSGLKIRFGGVNFAFSIDQSTRQSEVILPYGMELPTEVKVAEVLLSRRATGIAKGDILPVDAAGNLSVTVVSGDGKQSQVYQFQIRVELNTESNITRLVLDVSGEDYLATMSGKTGAVVLPNGRDVPATVVVKEIEISDDAMASLVENQTITLVDGAFSVSVTAQNGQVSEYVISVVSNPITDGSGNIYKEVAIGNQIWLTPDLHTFKFMDGSEIPTLGEGVAPEGDRPIHAFAQKSDAAYRDEGNFYTFATLIDKRGVCPEGYHVPDKDEALEILRYADAHRGASSLIQSVWTKKNIGGWADAPQGSPFTDKKYNDLVGFDGIPAGSRNGNGWYQDAGGVMLYWVNNFGSPNQIYFHANDTSKTPDEALQSWGAWKDGYSVKCVKNKQ